MAQDISPDELDTLLGVSPSTEDIGVQDISVSEGELNDLLGLRVIDEATGQAVKPAFSGASPNQAINEPVLDLADRAKLGFGNTAGNVEYLKSKFEDASINDKGRLTVKSNGAWYYADPNISEIEGAWDITKEVFADTVLDATQPAMLAAGGLAGGAVGTMVAPGVGTGSGAIAGTAFSEYLRTSMGRYLGTYQADPLQQTRDIALETALEFGGQKFLPGVKPTAKKVIKGLENVANKISNGPMKKGADVLWDFYGGLATSPEVTRTFRENPKQVLKIMKDNGGGFSRPVSYVNNIVQGKIDDTAKLAKAAPKMLSKAYVGIRNKILEAVPDTFSGDSRMYAARAYAQYLDQGASKLIDPTGNTVVDPKKFAETVQWIKDNGRLPQGWKVAMKSQEEIRQLVESGLPVDPAWRRAALNEDAYKSMREAHDLFAGFSQRFPARLRDGKTLAARGKGEAARMLDDKKEISRVLFDIADDNKLASMGDVSGYINSVRVNMDDITVKHFDKYGAGDKFQEMNMVYSKYSEKLLPLTRANRAAKTQGNVAYEQLMNQLSTRPDKNVTKKRGMEELIGLADRIGDTQASKMLRYTNARLEAADAAIALNPYVTRSGATDMGIGAYALASKNAALAGAIGAKATLGSARVQQMALRANYAGFEALKQIKSMPSNQIQFLLDNPEAATALIRSIQSAEDRGEQVENMFNSMFPPAPLRGPGDE